MPQELNKYLFYITISAYTSVLTDAVGGQDSSSNSSISQRIYVGVFQCNIKKLHHRPRLWLLHCSEKNSSINRSWSMGYVEPRTLAGKIRWWIKCILHMFRANIRNLKCAYFNFLLVFLHGQYKDLLLALCIQGIDSMYSRVNSDSINEWIKYRTNTVIIDCLLNEWTNKGTNTWLDLCITSNSLSNWIGKPIYSNSVTLAWQFPFSPLALRWTFKSPHVPISLGYLSLALSPAQWLVPLSVVALVRIRLYTRDNFLSDQYRSWDSPKFKNKFK